MVEKERKVRKYLNAGRRRKWSLSFVPSQLFVCLLGWQKQYLVHNYAATVLSACIVSLRMATRHINRPNPCWDG